MPNLTSSAAILRSQLRQRSRPAPTTIPLHIAIIGRREPLIILNASSRYLEASPLLSILSILYPAQKAFSPSPLNINARMLRSESKSLIYKVSCFKISISKEFLFAGLLIIIVAILPSFLRITLSCIFCPLFVSGYCIQTFQLINFLFSIP